MSAGWSGQHVRDVRITPHRQRLKQSYSAVFRVSAAGLACWFASSLCFASMAVTRTPGKSQLARQISFEDAWKPSGHSRFCCLIYATQNGWKLPILFEELQFPYDWCLVDFAKNEQKSSEFLKINPNGRIPALIDRERNVAVAESGAILEYICETLNSNLLPTKETNLEKHLQCKQWLYWQVSALGPMMGQSMYFNRIAATKGEVDSFSIARFGKEAERCLQMLDDQLCDSKGPFLLGEEVSAVDVACFAYAASAYWACVDISHMKKLQAWLQHLHERPSFKTGLTIPFARPAFFGPPWATEADIEAEIGANAAQFTIPEKK
ncbi:yfcG [Symbiodinium natans]|uniref:YfcG protein n=1 Tax=Symbiodinium natans TaxID=878477 RepID=A0A812GIK2_9DINO|nr:yfcG [Symbiodinium natans]